jgi:hypothetical protein
MKKLGALSLVLLIVTGALAAADGLAITGALNTGLVFDKPDSVDLTTYLSHEGTPGRAQLNFEYVKGDLSVKWRLETSQQFERNLTATATTDSLDGLIKYAFGTFGLLDNQIGVSIGRIDGALWASGGPADKSYDGVSGIRFEFKPSILEGLSAGFVLPATWDGSTPIVDGKGGNQFKPADYFSELIFGAKYALADTLDVRLALKLDGAGDDAAGAEEGTSFLWGISPTLLKGFVPGLTVWVDGQLAGLGVDDGFNTVTGFKVAYEQGDLAAALPLKLETFAKTSVDTKVGFSITPSLSYKVTPWLKPGVEVNLQFYSYVDTYKFGTTDPKAFDKFELKPYVEFDLGGGFTIVPYYELVFKGAYAPSSGTNDSEIDNKFVLRFNYSF